MTTEIEPRRTWVGRQVHRALERDKAFLNNLERWRTKLGARLGRNYLWILVPVVLVVYCVALVCIARRLPPIIVDLLDRTADAKAAEDVRSYAYAIGALLAALVVFATLPFALIKTWINERSTKNAEQGHITDRLNAAIEMLGAEKTVKVNVRSVTFRITTGEDEDGKPIHVEREVQQRLGDPQRPPEDFPDDAEVVSEGEFKTFETNQPNLEVRLGAIYALERIAQDSERDHITVMEVLCAYIRENAPASSARDHDLGDWPDWPEDADAHWKRGQNLRAWAFNLPPPRVDIQAALTVIGRRTPDQIEIERRQRRSEDDPGFRLDLRATNLQRADLSRANLDHALLTDAQMEGTNLRWAHMEGASLREAHMEGANLTSANIAGARVTEAWLQGAVLSGTNMEGADLRGARIEMTLVNEPIMRRANLRSARFNGALHLNQACFYTAFGDAATKLPDGIAMPDHWDDKRDPGYPDRKYDAWLDAGAPPGKPPAQAPDGGAD